MKRIQRLRRPQQFQRVRREGKTWQHPLLLLNAARSRRGKARCGIVVGKRLGKAVERNRARRRVREAVRLSYESIQPGWDLVFVVRPGVAEASFAQIQEAVQLLLQRGGLWREPQLAPGEPQLRA